MLGGSADLAIVDRAHVVLCIQGLGFRGCKYLIVLS